MKRITEAANLAALSISQANAQSPSLAFGLSHVVAADDGIARSCLESGYSTAVDVRYLQPVLTPLTAIELNARAFVFGSSPTCVDGFPPQDGTYLQADRINLLSESFVATELRFRVHLSRSPHAIALGAGAGNTWRAGDNLPYFIAAAEVPLVAHRHIRVSAAGEYLFVQVVEHRYTRTYQNFQVVASQSLGPSYTWRHAVSLALVMEVTLGKLPNP